MSQTAPFAPSLQFTDPTPVRVADIGSNKPFVLRHDLRTVFAQVVVRDLRVLNGSPRWCVVIATQEASKRCLGELVALDGEANAYPLTLRQHALYSVEH